MKKERGKSINNEGRFQINEDLIWGIHPVLEALKSHPGKVVEIVVKKERRGKKYETIIELARKAKIHIRFVQVLHLTGQEASQIRHQGVVARLSQTVLLPFEKVLERFRSQISAGEKPRLIICDTIQDPHNLGAVIRSAYSSGMSGVVVTKDRSAQPGGTVAKASAGALAHIDICQVTNLVTALKMLKEAGAWIFGAVKDESSQSIFEADFRLPACLIIGNEEKGVRPLVQKQCDFLVSIPMVGQLDSLNASVAAGVIMFEMLRQNS